MKTELNLYYRKYNKIGLPIVMAVLTVFLVFWAISPQLASIGELNREIEDKKQEISKLKDSLGVVSSTDEAQSNANMDLVNKALPGSKDISLIFSALSSAASASDADLENFSLKVGGVFGRPEKGKGTLSIDVLATVQSSTASSFVKFSDEIQKRLPLSEVTLIDVGADEGDYEISFYYKPYDLAQISKQDKVVPLGQSDITLLQQLQEWDR